MTAMGTIVLVIIIVKTWCVQNSLYFGENLNTEDIGARHFDLMIRMHPRTWVELGEDEQILTLVQLMHGDSFQLREAILPYKILMNRMADCYRMSMLTLMKSMAVLPEWQLRAMRQRERIIWNQMSEPQRRQGRAMVTIATSGLTDSQRRECALCIDIARFCHLHNTARMLSFDAELRYMLEMGWDDDQARQVMNEVLRLRGLPVPVERRRLQNATPRKQDYTSRCC